MKKAKNYDYIVINKSFEIAVNNLLSIIGAERLKTRRQLEQNENLALLLSLK